MECPLGWALYLPWSTKPVNTHGDAFAVCRLGEETDTTLQNIQSCVIAALGHQNVLQCCDSASRGGFTGPGRALVVGRPPKEATFQLTPGCCLRVELGPC